MKKMICLLAALLLFVMTAAPAYAAGEEFVPSITYKDAPEIEDAVMDDEDVGPCLIVSSILDCREESTDISQEARDELLEIYEELKAGDMELPLEDEDYVVRELVDVSWAESTCVEEVHGHEEWLEEPGNTVEITFDLGVSPSTDVAVFVYVDGEWIEVETENNGDGTVTCEFEQICPVAFCVDPDDETAPPATGDLAMDQILLWGGLMVLSLLLLILLLVLRRKEARD